MLCGTLPPSWDLGPMWSGPFMVGDDLKLLGDGGGIPKSPNRKEEVGGSIPGSEISSLLDKYLALTCRPCVSKKKKKRKKVGLLHTLIDETLPNLLTHELPQFLSRHGRRETKHLPIIIIDHMGGYQSQMACMACLLGGGSTSWHEGREPPTPTPNPRQSQKQREQRQGKARRYYVLTSFLTLLTHTTKAKEGKAQETGRKESNTDTGFVDPGYRLLLSFPHRSDNT